jgi:L-ascorbate metabolism protein UlaG (beta-lactamase superfamily)
MCRHIQAAHQKSDSMTPPRSDHFNGKTFFNPGERSDRGLRDLIKWKLTSRAAAWPGRVEVAPGALPPAPDPEGVAATWIGQSTFLLRAGGAAILTDPVYSDVAGPVPWLGPRRVTPPGLPLDATPRVDLVLLSHDHYDHCDLPSLRLLAGRDQPLAIAPLGHRALLSGAGMRRIVELDWWESHAAAPGVEVTLVPALHWCRRRPFATNVRLWGGFMVRAGARLVYFAGDSGYNECLFGEIGRRCGAPDLALIPIGAYEPRWFMKDAHMNPAEAVRVHQDVGARKSAAMHWGTFQLTDEGYDEPVRALAGALGAAGLSPGDFATPALGSTVVA